LYFYFSAIKRYPWLSLGEEFKYESLGRTGSSSIYQEMFQKIEAFLMVHGELMINRMCLLLRGLKKSQNSEERGGKRRTEALNLREPHDRIPLHLVA
jgi:hypothetical protein